MFSVFEPFPIFAHRTPREPPDCVSSIFHQSTRLRRAFSGVRRFLHTSSFRSECRPRPPARVLTGSPAPSSSFSPIFDSQTMTSEPAAVLPPAGLNDGPLKDGNAAGPAGYCLQHSTYKGLTIRPNSSSGTSAPQHFYECNFCATHLGTKNWISCDHKSDYKNLRDHLESHAATPLPPGRPASPSGEMLTVGLADSYNHQCLGCYRKRMPTP